MTTLRAVGDDIDGSGWRHWGQWVTVLRAVGDDIEGSGDYIEVNVWRHWGSGWWHWRQWVTTLRAVGDDIEVNVWRHWGQWVMTLRAVGDDIEGSGWRHWGQLSESLKIKKCSMNAVEHVVYQDFVASKVTKCHTVRAKWTAFIVYRNQFAIFNI